MLEGEPHRIFVITFTRDVVHVTKMQAKSKKDFIVSHFMMLQLSSFVIKDKTKFAS